MPGKEKNKVYDRLFDPKDYCDLEVLIVGRGDRALESAIAMAQCGGKVSLSHRRTELSRPKPDNIEKLEKLINDPHAEVAIETPVSERVNASRWYTARHGTV